MNDRNFSKDFFIENRRKLSKLLKTNSLVILHSNDEMPRNGDQFFPFRQNSDMLYLTGLQQEKTIFCFFPDCSNENMRELVFIVESNKKQEIWEGHKYSTSEVRNISGIKNVMYISDFDTVIRNLLLKADFVYLHRNEYPNFSSDVTERNVRFSHALINDFPELKVERLAPILSSLRVVKEPNEIELMKTACDITEQAFRKVLSITKPNIFEYQIEAEISCEFRKSGANGHAYAPIVASGKNACILHYIDNSDVCKTGELVLLDFGAEYMNYAADCSRTIPVNGVFSHRQAQCYEAVLRVFKKAKQLFIPGNSIVIINKKVNKWMEDEMIELALFSRNEVENQDDKMPMYFNYYMHGTSHFIGLDVHDVGAKEQLFEKGMVLTCEPGIYIENEGVGIRIENDIMVGNPPVDLMENIPIEIKEIETLMNINN